MRLYEVRAVKDVESGDAWALALAATRVPDRQLATASATWTLLLWNPSSGATATVPLHTEIPQYKPGIWDSIATSLEFDDGGLWVEVSYFKHGEKPSCEQRFDFWIRARQGPELVLERSEQTLDACD